ncbi:MAG: DASH family cryptochrome [Saprospiraceae bacterium]|nr:DASH family cryptochrome [Saprospiraceae bacterium]
MGTGKKIILWFRNDLRLHDNESLMDAIEAGAEILPVYVFDERVFKGTTSFGFEKTGVYRSKFLIESIQNLRSNLKGKGADLIVRTGKPEQILYEIAREVKSDWVFCNRERTDEERKVQDRLEQKLWSIGQEIRFARGKMLLYTSDLPFPITHMPDTFTSFRKEVEKFVPVREPLPSPDRIPFLRTTLDPGAIPDLKDFGKKDFSEKHLEHQKFKGGEDEAIKQLKYYIWDSRLIAGYKESRNELLGWDFSSKFSPWLAAGCLSPKLIFSELKKFENSVLKNDSTYWLYFELLWRDFFRLIAKKHGNKIFQYTGTRSVSPEGRTDKNLFNKWAKGKTGVPFVDANMRQLNETGFMSNRGRQNVASFLAKDLKINWLMGAEYFESLLIDYDPSSNYGNWNYIAGVGSDPREDRYFNISVQSKRYDPDGSFIRYWLPELKNADNNLLFSSEHKLNDLVV